MQQGHLYLAFLLIVVYSVADVYGVDECHVLWPVDCKQGQCAPIRTNGGVCCNMTEESGANGAVCCNMTDFDIKETLGGTKNYKFLHLYNVTMQKLTLAADSHLESLTITGGNVKNISVTGQFSDIKCLNLSANNLVNVTIDKGKMPKLRILDLSKNNLTNLPDIETILNLKHNTTLDISGNNFIDCNIVRELIDRKKKSSQKHYLEFRNRNKTFCAVQISFQWFTDAAHIGLPQLDVTDTQCQQTVGHQGCRCKVYRYIPQPTKEVLITLDVNCTNLQLKSLPSRLPPNTVSLDVSNNNITSLDQMKDSSYSGISTLFVSNNCISSIEILEGTSFISNFSILDLRHNNLTSVPTYFLSNSFDRNIASKVLLGGNKLMCDCNTAQGLKWWFKVNKEYIKDFKDVGCRNIAKKVMDLEQHDVCVTSRKWTDYIYYIIAGEVTLLIFLVSKVSYDYWVFKTAGYLPWPASKMPKLPCDWVFET